MSRSFSLFSDTKMQPLFDMAEWERRHAEPDFSIPNPVYSPVGNLWNKLQSLESQQQEMLVILKDMKTLQQNMLQVILKNQREMDALKRGLDFADSVV